VLRTGALLSLILGVVSLEDVQAGLVHDEQNVYTEYADHRRDYWSRGGAGVAKTSLEGVGTRERRKVSADPDRCTSRSAETACDVTRNYLSRSHGDTAFCEIVED
jgi:hypothetical protein